MLIFAWWHLARRNSKYAQWLWLCWCWHAHGQNNPPKGSQRQMGTTWFSHLNNHLLNRAALLGFTHSKDKCLYSHWLNSSICFHVVSLQCFHTIPPPRIHCLCSSICFHPLKGQMFVPAWPNACSYFQVPPPPLFFLSLNHFFLSPPKQAWRHPLQSLHDLAQCHSSHP